MLLAQLLEPPLAETYMPSVEQVEAVGSAITVCSIAMNLALVATKHLVQVGSAKMVVTVLVAVTVKTVTRDLEHRKEPI